MSLRLAMAPSSTRAQARRYSADAALPGRHVHRPSTPVAHAVGRLARGSWNVLGGEPERCCDRVEHRPRVVAPARRVRVVVETGPAPIGAADPVPPLADSTMG